ncbi:MAG: GntR family transcriptional regulator [Anaerolinea sp.]|nr:GntR family transcriptional regulator [Anaerolinea sp.]
MSRESASSQKRVKRNVFSGSLPKQVYHQLRMSILRGEIAPNTKLVELTLAEQTGTSQGTIRDALQRLERDGLVERREHRGTYVTDLPTDEMQEVFAIRGMIEAYAVRRAIRFATAADLQHMEHLHGAMSLAAQQDNFEELVELDLEFHRTICEMAQSHLLLNAWGPLYSSIQRFIYQTHPRYFSNLQELADTHLPLLNALQQRDADRAAELVHGHLRLIWTLIDDAARKADQTKSDKSHQSSVIDPI